MPQLRVVVTYGKRPHPLLQMWGGTPAAEAHMIQLRKVGRAGGLFGLLFRRAVYVTAEAVELDGVVVPAGFPTDIASAPWWVRWLLPNDHMRDAAIRHDMRRKLQTQRDLDDIDKDFHRELIAAGTVRFWAFVCWWVVRFNNNR